MPLDRSQIAARLMEFAALLELTGANPFRVRALANGARVLGGLASFERLLATAQLTSIKGIGEGLAEHVQELATTGTLQECDALAKTIPPGVVEMLDIPGVGPKTARRLWQELQLTTVDALAQACGTHRLAAVAGMGEKTEQKILHGIDYLRTQHGRHLYPGVALVAYELAAALTRSRVVQRIEVAGSIRRHNEIVKDIDLVASTRDAERLMAAFVAHPLVGRVVQHGPTISSVQLRPGFSADLRCVTETEFPYALLHLTGSKAHNVALRARAQQMGMQLNEYGLFKSDGTVESLVPCVAEDEIYAALQLAFIPPELREDCGEIADAANGALPDLLTYDDLQGVFHCHTTYSDGRATLAEMADAAAERGFRYLGVTDHSQSVTYARGLEPARVREQWREIERLNTNGKIRIYKGTEVDILKDGALDYPDELLRGFDFVIASVHTHFTLTRDEMTARVIRALRHPAVRVLGHPTGRLLLSREPFAVDLEAVLRVAGEEGVVVETNCNPQRAELDWRLARTAQSCGVRTMISPDAHHVDGLDYLRFGVGIARKGGWTRAHVVNAWTPRAVERWLGQ
ncbi:MAG: DNA polymerase/3'-5' exonuclease PolX [Deltaproteobacteria bacterium]|nr:DNA polymerase/3'-5' exonuclease PolX [Deltaproteobacteria bacterium]